jgi:HlyD family secretion protein
VEGALNDKTELAPDAGRNALFLGAALERLNSPEQLDQRIALIPPGMWVMAIAAAVIVVSGFVWAIFGSVPTRATGHGILLADAKGSFTVQPITSGPIIEILVKPGDRVAAGAVIARLRQDSLSAQLAGATTRVAALSEDLDRLRKADAAEILKNDDTARRQQAAIGGQITAGTARINRLTSILSGYEDLLAKGIMSRVEVANMQQQYDQTVMDVANARAKKIEVEATAAQKRDDLVERQRQKQAEIDTIKADLGRLQAEHTIGSEVKAPVAGVIEDLRVGLGDVVLPGTVITTIGDTATPQFEIIALFSDANARRVMPGMDVHVMPATVKKEEHGAMRGRVVSVSRRVVSTADVNAILRNPELTKSLMGDGAPLLARISVVAAPDTPSGFAWWTGSGPPYRVVDGTRGTVDVIVEQRRPINLVVPALRKLLGIEG